MAVSRRARLCLIASGSAGLLFALIEVLGLWLFAQNQLHSAEGALQAALSLVNRDLTVEPDRTDLQEVVDSNPEISLAVYNSDGSLWQGKGAIRLPLSLKLGFSQFNNRTFLSRSAKHNESTILAALDYTRRAENERELVLLAVLIWFPLVGAIALSTWFASKATFEPLERLTQEAEELTQGGLSSRLVLENPGEYEEFVLRLNRFLDKIESSVRREERFLGDAAHELRTPITILQGHIDTCLQRERSSAEYRETLEGLLNETQRMAKLVELLLHSASASQKATTSVDLAQVAQRGHARWVDRYSSRNVQLHLETQSTKVAASEAELDVVVDNLLSNALRASPPNTEATIITGNGRLEVRDSGVGIPAEESARVFERFARLDVGRNRAEGGFGIGLALCKRIVDSQGGRIWTEPNLPQGARFIIEYSSQLKSA